MQSPRDPMSNWSPAAGDTSTLGGIDREVVFHRPLQIDLKIALQTAALGTWGHTNRIWEVVNKQ